MKPVSQRLEPVPRHGIRTEIRYIIDIPPTLRIHNLHHGLNDSRWFYIGKYLRASNISVWFVIWQENVKCTMICQVLGSRDLFTIYARLRVWLSSICFSSLFYCGLLEFHWKSTWLSIYYLLCTTFSMYLFTEGNTWHSQNT